MKNVDYDLVIIGGGPAGLTAGLYASRARLKVILVEKIVVGGQIVISDWIENYPGFPEGLSGPDLAQRLTEQAKRFGLNIENNEAVSVDLSDQVKTIVLNDRSVTTHTIIIATGASPKKLGVPGEEMFYGKGVSSCATCDAPFFKDRIVAAVGGSDTAVKESLFLTKFVEKVYLIHRRDRLRAEMILQEQALANEKIEIIWDSVLTGIKGFTNVENITVQNAKTKEEKTLSVDGCFIWVGEIPNTKFLAEGIKLDEKGFIVANLNMETSVPGVFAAGDVRNTPLRQVATAVGDGAVAAFSAGHYIENLKK
ncbi:MAG: thioredoxin-disulfide reductase [Deltaproteobacteria bacterium]|jgi:thioredoxin reductase (NADPH)|nr:thioredoxin-disulfide reductase [Deltaproteobacteria bacterium]MBW2239442.1 thioredoxin-disulfide reductase [Deltaproteobacteria bacterium]MBW2573015.1 thioredoxin-disulfide reductase [Deltaproteobacteria bacterium]MBW2668305.1 thioredoxin-disulfide reductase [Deltaproteobacteria bacterium]